MRILLDTQCWPWMAASPERLSVRARSLVETTEHELLLSAASAWEIAIKHALGKLRLPEPPASWSRRASKRCQPFRSPIEHDHALRVAALPPHHRNPFVRPRAVAQAQIEDLPILTRTDEVFTKYRRGCDRRLTRPRPRSDDRALIMGACRRSHRVRAMHRRRGVRLECGGSPSRRRPRSPSRSRCSPSGCACRGRRRPATRPMSSRKESASIFTVGCRLTKALIGSAENIITPTASTTAATMIGQVARPCPPP